MEQQEKQRLRTIAERQVEDAGKYAKARESAGIAEMNLNIILVANIEEIRKLKKNAGIEFAQLMICETNDAAKEYYQTWKKNEAFCKGLEKLIEARAGQLMCEQALMRNEREGTRWG